MPHLTHGALMVRAIQAGPVEGSRKVRIWFAAVPRDEAVAAVRDAVSAGWDVRLSDELVPSRFADQIGLRAGDVREFTT